MLVMYLSNTLALNTFVYETDSLNMMCRVPDLAPTRRYDLY